MPDYLHVLLASRNKAYLERRRLCCHALYIVIGIEHYLFPLCIRRMFNLKRPQNLGRHSPDCPFSHMDAGTKTTTSAKSVMISVFIIWSGGILIRSLQIGPVAIRVVKGGVSAVRMVECVDRDYYSRIFRDEHVIVPAILLGAVGNTVWYSRPSS
jgi:hypothetical protein